MEVGRKVLAVFMYQLCKGLGLGIAMGGHCGKGAQARPWPSMQIAMSKIGVTFIMAEIR